MNKSTENDSSQKRILHWALGILAVLLLLSIVATVAVLRWMRKDPPDLGEIWSVKGGRAFMNVRRKDDDSLELRFVYPLTSCLATPWRS